MIPVPVAVVVLIEIIFPRTGNHRFGKGQLGFGAAANADNFHAVNGLRTQTANVANANAGLTKAAAGNGEMIGWRVIFTCGAAHHDLTARRAGIVAVNGEIVAYAVIGCTE